MLLLLLLAGAAVYANSLRGPFIFDDNHTIVNNRHLRHLWPLTRSMSAPPDSGVAGRPLVCLSLALNYAFGGMDVRGYHVFNLGVHLLAGLTLFGLVRRTLLSPAFHGRLSEPAASWTAMLVSLLWLVHPLTTDAVTFISNRSESMMALFVLLAIYGVNRAASAPRPARWQAAAVASTLLGVMCKEVAVVIPVLALMYVRIFLRDPNEPSRRIRWTWMFAGMFLTWVVTIALLMTVDIVSKAGLREVVSPWHNLLTQSGILVMYLRLAFWPHPLVIDYDDWPIATSVSQVWPQGLCVVALLLLTVWALRRRPMLGFLGAWFFVTLAPTSSVLPLATEIATERRMYLPLMAVATLAVLALHRFVGRKSRRVEAMAVAVVAVTLGILTMLRNNTYADARMMWEDVLAHRPQNARAHTNLGVELAGTNVDEAIEHHLISLHFRPDSVDTHNNLGMALAMKGRLEEAAAEFRWVLERHPNLADVRANLGAALGEMGRLDESIEQLKRALELDPNLRSARQMLPLAIKAKETRDAAATRPATNPAR